MDSKYYYVALGTIAISAITAAWFFSYQWSEKTSRYLESQVLGTTGFGSKDSQELSYRTSKYIILRTALAKISNGSVLLWNFINAGYMTVGKYTRTQFDAEFARLMSIAALPPPPPPPALIPSLEFTSDKTTVPLNGKIVVTWKAVNVDHCDFSHAGTYGPINTAIQWTLTISPVTNSIVYGMSCSGKYGTVAKQLIITIEEVVNIKGPGVNIMGCLTRTGSSNAGELWCYGMWDYGNEFGGDTDMCGGYSLASTGCIIQTKTCTTGKAKATKAYTSMNTLGTTELAIISKNLGSTPAAVKAQIVTLWEYTCEGTPVPPPPPKSDVKLSSLLINAKGIDGTRIDNISQADALTQCIAFRDSKKPTTGECLWNGVQIYAFGSDPYAGLSAPFIINITPTTTLFPKIELTQQYALTNCKTFKETNPNFSIMCTWGGMQIYSSSPSDGSKLGEYIQSPDNGWYIKMSGISQYDALANCIANKALANPKSLVCGWNGTKIYGFQSTDNIGFFDTLNISSDKIASPLPKITLSIQDALMNCKTFKESNPNFSILCTWGGARIFSSSPTDTLKIGEFTQVIDGVTYWPISNISQADALSICTVFMEIKRSVKSMNCSWNGAKIFSYISTDVVSNETLIVNFDKIASTFPNVKLSLPDALSNCKTLKEAHPTISLMCTWGGTKIFSSSPADTFALGYFKIGADSGTILAITNISQADALSSCITYKELKRPQIYQCNWNDKLIYSYKASDTTIPFGTLIVNIDEYPLLFSKINISEQDALTNCKTFKESHPNISLMCTWGPTNKMIYPESVNSGTWTLK